METQLVGTDAWVLELPEDWSVEEDEEGLVISDPDGVGVLEISTLERDDGDVSSEELDAFAAELIEAGVARQKASLGPFKGWLYAHQDEDSWLREWFLSCGGLFLYVTYQCDMDNKGLDDEAIDGILAGIELQEEDEE